jgi:hypothetical protein
VGPQVNHGFLGWPGAPARLASTAVCSPSDPTCVPSHFRRATVPFLLQTRVALNTNSDIVRIGNFEPASLSIGAEMQAIFGAEIDSLPVILKSILQGSTASFRVIYGRHLFCSSRSILGDSG